MSIVTAIFLSMVLLIVTGCASSSDPPAAKQGTGKKESTMKPAKHDEEKSMNEESQRAIMDR
jgi:Flp pilus assembly protein TadD